MKTKYEIMTERHIEAVKNRAMFMSIPVFVIAIVLLFSASSKFVMSQTQSQLQIYTTTTVSECPFVFAPICPVETNSSYAIQNTTIAYLTFSGTMTNSSASAIAYQLSSKLGFSDTSYSLTQNWSLQQCTEFIAFIVVSCGLSLAAAYLFYKFLTYEFNEE